MTKMSLIYKYIVINAEVLSVSIQTKEFDDRFHYVFLVGGHFPALKKVVFRYFQEDSLSERPEFLRIKITINV